MDRGADIHIKDDKVRINNILIEIALFYIHTFYMYKIIAYLFGNVIEYTLCNVVFLCILFKTISN
jgi:hypothetical protein